MKATRAIVSVLGFPVSMSSEFGQWKVDFQTLVVHGQVNFIYWIEQLMVSKCSISHNCTNEE
jgi:hypothetical protein